MWPPRRDAVEGMLADVRILDFTTYVPGPYCTQMLADMGADVIKVEPPQGDPARAYPGGMYEIANRNKRAIVLDLKNPEHQAQARELAADADMLFESFRPGVADRLGIGYARIKQERPDIIFCSISGFGQSGPWKERPGHDLTYLAVTGALSFSPHWQGKPRRSGVPIADLSASSFAAISALAALHHRARTGEGAQLDVAIADSTMAFIAPRGGPGLKLRDEDRLGVYANNDLFETADGETLAVSAVEAKFWTRLRKGRAPYAPELADAKFDRPEDRRKSGDDLFLALSRAFAQRPAAHWVALFERLDVPVERTVPLAEAARSENVLARGIVKACDGDEQVVFPVHRNGNAIGFYRTRAPELGAHNHEIISALESKTSR